MYHMYKMYLQVVFLNGTKTIHTNSHQSQKFFSHAISQVQLKPEVGHTCTWLIDLKNMPDAVGPAVICVWYGSEPFGLADNVAPSWKKLACAVSLWRDAQPVHHKHCWHHPPPRSLHKYYMNHGWTADICKIYCALLLRGILRMPNIYHLNRWKLQRRDGSGVGGVNKGKGTGGKGWWGGGACVSVCVC